MLLVRPLYTVRPPYYMMSIFPLYAVRPPTICCPSPHYILSVPPLYAIHPPLYAVRPPHYTLSVSPNCPYMLCINFRDTAVAAASHRTKLPLDLGAPDKNQVNTAFSDHKL